MDYVDIFHRHRPDPDTPLDEAMSALRGIVAPGEALYAGVSPYGPELTGRHLQRRRATPARWRKSPRARARSAAPT